MQVAPFSIENETRAEEYLRNLFRNPAYRSMQEIHKSAEKYIVDANVRTYFVNRAKSILRSYGQRVD